MKNNVKRIIACTLSITAFTSTAIMDCNEKFLSNIAYADTTNSNSVLLDGIHLSEGDDLDFSPEVKSYTVRVKKNVSHVDVRVNPQGKDKKIKVTINDNIVDEDDSYESEVDLEKGENIITINVRSKSNEEKCETYTVKVIRSVNAADDENVPDDIYLDYLCVGTEEVKLSKDVIKYTVNVDESVSELKIKAQPEHDDYEVKLDKDLLKKNSKFRTDVDLKKGENVFKIKLKNDDEVRIYTLVVNRGKVDSTDTNSAVDSTDNNKSENVTEGNNVDTNKGSENNTSSVNQWVQVGEKWQYNDSVGNPIKNVWFFDKNVSKYYYLQADGFRATGWLNNNNNWYLLDSNGEMQTGWKKVDGSWYLLESSGEMKVGWFQDTNGYWYYLDSDGRMHTGWLQNSSGDYYYLDTDGKMITGWLQENGKWYYLNKDGRMETKSVTIKGKVYNFKENGELK